MKHLHILLLAAPVLLAACTSTPSIQEFVTSTIDEPWSGGIIADAGATISDNINIDTTDLLQTIEGFGVCFSELSAESLGLLSESDRAAVLSELFLPGAGANLTINRTPVAANDFALDWYSYDETDGDFAMEHFSIERDMELLVPLIKSAQALNPNMKIWASPWCPPTWMKRNRHYAMAPAPVNDLTEEQRGYEGQDMFIQSDDYFEAYALYFEKYIQAYKALGIDIFMVMPQNEPNSAQNFPSCCWTSAGLDRFISHLGPRMNDNGVEVFFGTCERPNTALIDTVLTSPASGKYISGVGFQWAGRSAVTHVRDTYPDKTLIMTEQECGNGRNDWDHASHCWDLLKDYLSNGVSIYNYWNLSLKDNGLSRWAWRQNSLVIVNPDDATYRYSIEYYLLKHASHYVHPGARLIRTDPAKDLLTFKNPDGSTVILLANKDKAPTTIQLTLDANTNNNASANTYTVTLKPQSFSTIILK